MSTKILGVVKLIIVIKVVKMLLYLRVNLITLKLSNYNRSLVKKSYNYSNNNNNNNNKIRIMQLINN